MGDGSLGGGRGGKASKTAIHTAKGLKTLSKPLGASSAGGGVQSLSGPSIMQMLADLLEQSGGLSGGNGQPPLAPGGLEGPRGQPILNVDVPGDNFQTNPYSSGLMNPYGSGVPSITEPSNVGPVERVGGASSSRSLFSILDLLHNLGLR